VAWQPSTSWSATPPTDGGTGIAGSGLRNRLFSSLLAKHLHSAGHESHCLWSWPVFVHIVQCLQFFWNRCTMLQVIVTPTCRVSGYPRQVIRVDALLRQLRFIWTALPTVITLVTIIPLGTYNTSSWYIFLLFFDDHCLLESSG
jgi:hypothetical protein